jgi:hypothetical protein
MPKLSVFMMPALMFIHTAAFAQDRGIELQGGVGYVLDSGEGPSVPAVNAAAVAWLTRGWGVGARLTEGLTDDDIGQSFAPGDLRIWAITSQWRWTPRAFEVNAGIGAGGHGYRFKSIQTGERTRSRNGSGFVALDLLVGHHLAGPVHIKGGFTFGLSGDLFPFQPVVLFAFKP